MGGTLNSDPVAVSWGSGRLDIFALGTDNAVYVTSAPKHLIKTEMANIAPGGIAGGTTVGGDGRAVSIKSESLSSSPSCREESSSSGGVPKFPRHN